MVEVVLEPKADGAQPHRHDRSSELFYVLYGEVDVLAGNDILRASQGDTIVMADAASRVLRHCRARCGAPRGHRAGR